MVFRPRSKAGEERPQDIWLLQCIVTVLQDSPPHLRDRYVAVADVFEDIEVAALDEIRNHGVPSIKLNSCLRATRLLDPADMWNNAVDRERPARGSSLLLFHELVSP